jgi:integrase
VLAVRIDDSGDGLRLLQEHLGHRSITTTMQYRKVAGEELRIWYRKLWRESDDRYASETIKKKRPTMLIRLCLSAG